MSISKFCIQQRQQEQQQLKKLLIFGFASSTLLHGIAAYALPYLSVESPRVEKPLELVIVDQPKPKPPEVKIKPQPKIEPKPIVKSEPKPTPQPEPVKAATPPPLVPKPEPVKAATPPPPVPKPEPVKAVTPPPPVPKPEPVKAATLPPPVPKPEPLPPIPQKLLTAPTSAPSSSSVSVPSGNTFKPTPLNNSFTSATSSASDSANNNDGSSSSGVPGGVGTSSDGSASSGGESGIACVNNCEPEYPDALEGAEGSAGVKLTIDLTGNVIGAELASADSNSQVNRQALLAAKQMEFSSPPGGNAASVQVKINFTVEGSDYDRLAREEQAAKERQEQETARKQQREEEKQARIRQQQQREQAKPKPQLSNNQASPKPLPTLMETEADEEQLQKFRERIENRGDAPKFQKPSRERV